MHKYTEVSAHIQVIMKENTALSERLSYLIDYLDVSKNKFGRDLGYPRSQIIYDIIDEHKKKKKPIMPSFEFFEKFLNSEYSEIISIEWFITGKGEMLKQNRINDDTLNDKSENYGLSRLDRMLNILDSQQRTIESQTEIIGELSKKKKPENRDNGNSDIAGSA